MHDTTKVLIVDDNPIDREAVGRLLGDGYHLTTASTGGEGVALCRSTKPHCVLLDYRLPDQDGVTCLPSFLEEYVGVVMITGVDERSIAISSLRAGAHDYLSKVELTRDNLERAVRNACEKANLMRSLDLYRRVVEHMPIAVLVARVGLDREIVEILWRNQAATDLFGEVHDDDVETLTGVIPEIAASPAVARVFEAIQTRAATELDDLALNDRCFHLRIAPLEQQLVALLFNDTTERVRSFNEQQRIEGELHAAQRLEAVGRLAGGLAHDFNNMLTVITAHGEMLRDAVGPQARLRDHIDGILGAADRSAHLTRQLLAYGRRQIRSVRVVNVNNVVLEVREMLDRLLGEDVELSSVLDANLAATQLDPWQLQQVIVNLAINARDAMPTGGMLIIETSNVVLDEAFATKKGVAVPPGEYVQLNVTDTGTGIDPETLANVFEPFFTTKPKDKGTGLGLSMVFGVVKQSGGFIWIYSEVGSGTTVKIFLPAVEEPCEVWPTKPQPAKTSLAAGENVLVLEDDAYVRKAAARILRRGGYTVLEATNGREAVNVANAHEGRIQLLLTDVVMPGMSGTDAAKEIRKAHPALEVLYMSGYTNHTIVNQGILAADTQFIAKPFAREALLAKVREILDAARDRAVDADAIE